MKRLTISSGSAALAADVTDLFTETAADSTNNPTVVFLHAGVSDRRSWASAMSAVGAKYRAIAYDRRGFGDTTYQPEAFSHVDDLRAVLDDIGAGSAVLVGNSQGGRIAIDFALRWPERVTALVLIAPAISGRPDPDALPEPVARLDEAIEAAESAGDLAEVNRLEAHLWLDGATAPEFRVGGDLRTLFLAMNGLALEAPSPGEEREPPSAWQRLGELAMPVLCLIGDLDLNHCVAGVRHITAQAQQAEVIVVPGTAHLPQMEQPGDFGRTLLAFLDRHLERRIE